jgi:hypothetical protein
MVRKSGGIGSFSPNGGQTMSKTEDAKALGFDIDNFPMPDEGQPMEVYADALLRLRSNADFFSRSLGRISWIQGKVLLRARRACPRGQWQKFLHLLDRKPNGKPLLTPETARLLMRVAETVSEANSRKLEYIEMLRMVYPSFKQTINEDAAADYDIDKKSDSKRGEGMQPKTMLFDQFRKRLKSLLTKTQDLTRHHIQFPDDDRELENLRRIVETMLADVLGALSMPKTQTPSDQRRAA